MKFVVIEDEPLSAKHLTNLLHKLDANYQIIGVLDSVEASVNFLSANKDYDIILADINLSDGLSFDVFSKVDVRAPVIFTTAFDEYAVKAFKLNSIDFLLKPIGIEDLELSIEKAIAAKNDNPRGFSLSNMRYVLKRDYKRRFLVKINGEPVPIKEEDISFFNLKGGVLHLCTPAGDQFSLEFIIDELETLLDPTSFFRVNKNTIVSHASVEACSPGLNGQLFITCKHLPTSESTVSRDKANDFSDWLKR